MPLLHTTLGVGSPLTWHLNTAVDPANSILHKSYMRHKDDNVFLLASRYVFVVALSMML